MSEQAILDLTCQMTMAATTHRTKGCSDKSAALAIIQGFTGQLKGWWDNLCTENDRLTILNSVKNETNQEDGNPTLRWYKDTFLSKVTLREYGFLNFWKEKFIAGLPKLFSEKVRMNLERHYGQPIAYESLTYGQLHNIIVETGIQVCTDFKLQNKIKKESTSSKRELGTFCNQYEVEPMRTPSACHKKKQKQERSYNRSYKQYRRSTYKRKRVSNKNQNPIVENKQRFNKKQRHKNIKREVKCWRCGKVGHYANKCRVMQKINQLEDETLKKNLLNILINSDNEESSSEELEESEDNLELEQIETLNENSRKEISNISMKEIINRFKPTNQQVTVKDLQEEIKILKQEIQRLKTNDIALEYRMLELEGKELVKKVKGKEKVVYEEIETDEEDKEDPYINILNLITTHKWHTEITLVIKEEIFKITTLIDSGADVNCIQEGLIPTQYYEKTLERVTSANGSKMNIQYKFSNARVCKGQICYNTSFVLVKNINTSMILGTLFLTLLYPFQVWG
ncbi:hypothetical protein CR513_12569, partial [Mucuna pruriens]